MQTSLVEITLARYIDAMQNRDKNYIGSSLRCIGRDMWILTDMYTSTSTDRLDSLHEILYSMAYVIGEIQE